MTSDERSRALCRDYPHVDFFPDHGGLGDAMEVCYRCPVRRPCLDYAVKQRIEHGVWGGMSERARVRLRGMKK